MRAKARSEEYWDRNIEEWGKFYLNLSHSGEALDAPAWLRAVYRRTIMPIEARLMAERYRLTMDFFARHVQDDMTVVDVGCGTGIFTVELLRRGANVKAVDYTLRALELTKTLVERMLPDRAHAAEYLRLDATRDRMPDSDLVIAMGVTPYVDDLASFYANILPTTKMFYCLILDPRHWANRVRRLIPALNVRNLRWFDRPVVDSLLERHHWRLIERKNFASGYLDTAVRSAWPEKHASASQARKAQFPDR